MAIDSDLIARDMLGIIADAEETFTWNGADYACTRSPINRTKPLEVGGYMDIPDLTVVTTYKKEAPNGDLVSRFPSDIAPDINAQMTIDSVAYRITGRTIDEFGGSAGRLNS